MQPRCNEVVGCSNWVDMVVLGATGVVNQANALKVKGAALSAEGKGHSKKKLRGWEDMPGA